MNHTLAAGGALRKPSAPIRFSCVHRFSPELSAASEDDYPPPPPAPPPTLLIRIAFTMSLLRLLYVYYIVVFDNIEH